jgi:hypothetical protein
MKFAKGQPRPEKAGRKKGVPNRNTREVREIIDSCTDMESVFASMAKIASGPRPNPLAARFLAEYRYGKPSQTIDLNHAGRIDIGLDEARHIIDHLFNGHSSVDAEVPSEVGLRSKPVQDSEQG